MLVLTINITWLIIFINVVNYLNKFFNFIQKIVKGISYFTLQNIICLRIIFFRKLLPTENFLHLQFMFYNELVNTMMALLIKIILLKTRLLICSSQHSDKRKEKLIKCKYELHILYLYTICYIGNGGMTTMCGSRI